jgi:DNA-binding transcriptional LysR family regulator
LDLATLEIFLAVAADRSVTKAAKAIGRVPSNVTTRIQQLEQDLGVALFSRDGKKMTLTGEGETFLAYANRLTALALEARQAVRPLTPSGSLHLGTMESTAASRLPAPLTQFNRMWPDVSVRLTMGVSPKLTRSVLAGELDCALIARPPPAVLAEQRSFSDDLQKLQSELIFIEELVVLLPPGHPDIRSASDLRVGSLAALEPGCTYRRVAEFWARKSSAVKTMEVGSYHAILASVATGQAAGVMPKSVLELMHWPGNARMHDLGPVETFLVSRRGDRASALDAFHDVLIATRGKAPHLPLG